jgi:hypothetical protein
MSNVTINQLPTASTIDPIQDYLPIYTASATATQGINRNTLLGLASAPVGLTDTQTISGKTLTSPTINGATLSGTLSGTYTIGGTPTFPTSVTQNTATQTLTNKTLTSPTINSPTITNASITADSITGYTTSNNGSIYGISVSGGQITNAAIANATIGSAQIATNGIAAANLATSAITLGYAQITSSFTTTSTSAVQVTGLTSAVTIPAGGRKVKITAWTGSMFTSSASTVTMTIWDGTVGSGTQLAFCQVNQGSVTNTATGAICMAVVTPAAGSKTYNVGFFVGGGTGTFYASSIGPAFILVEAI